MQSLKHDTQILCLFVTFLNFVPVVFGQNTYDQLYQFYPAFERHSQDINIRKYLNLYQYKYNYKLK